MIRVHVDPALCQGHGRCYTLASALFEPDDVGDSHEIGDGTVAAEHERLAHLAVDNCPEHAITIVVEERQD